MRTTFSDSLASQLLRQVFASPPTYEIPLLSERFIKLLVEIKTSFISYPILCMQSYDNADLNKFMYVYSILLTNKNELIETRIVRETGIERQKLKFLPKNFLYANVIFYRFIGQCKKKLPVKTSRSSQSRINRV